MSDDGPSSSSRNVSAARAKPASAGRGARALPALRISLLRREPAWKTSGVMAEGLTKAARAAFRAGFSANAETAPWALTLLLSNDAELRALNRDWRGKDSPTNVLSFPSGEPIRPRGGPVALGDIVLGFETVQREARELGISLQDHAVHLVVHGVLHLLGFDHHAAPDAERMERLETAILAALGIADPYGEGLHELNGAAR
jgi:probable rRNA maturation factor